MPVGVNYFLEISPECVTHILNQLGYEEVGRAACVCREFYKGLTVRAKPIAHTIQCVGKRTRKKWGSPELTALTHLYLDGNQITDIKPLGSLTALTYLYLSGNQGKFSGQDETVILLKSRGCYVLV